MTDVEDSAVARPPRAPPALAPIELLPAEVLMQIHQRVRAGGRTIAIRQRRSYLFGSTCRAFRHAQRLTPLVGELAVSGEAQIEAAVDELNQGTLKPNTIQHLEISLTQDEFETASELLTLLSGALVGLDLMVVGGQRRRGARWTRPTDQVNDQLQPLLSGLALCKNLERAVLGCSDDFGVFTISKLQELASAPLNSQLTLVWTDQLTV